MIQEKTKDNLQQKLNKIAFLVLKVLLIVVISLFDKNLVETMVCLFQ